MSLKNIFFCYNVIRVNLKLELGVKDENKSKCKRHCRISLWKW